MPGNLERFRAEIKQLRDQAKIMQLDLGIQTGAFQNMDDERKEVAKGTFMIGYQHWYTASREVIRQLIPGRLSEFDEAYRSDPKRRKLDAETYKIQDWLLGLRSTGFDGVDAFPHADVALARFGIQVSILGAAERRLDSAVHDMLQLLQADMFDSELEEARELLKKGFFRAAGAVSGVVLERHLASIATNHRVRIAKKSPTISDLNDPLRDAAVYDLPTWRNIQRLADIRNLCDHNKDREPTADEVAELIAGTDKLTKTTF